MSYNPNPTVEQGGVQKVDTTNLTVEDYLSRILKTLDVIAYHMQVITDETIEKSELE